MSDITAFIQQAPPVSRTIAGATFLLSFAAHALNVVHPAQLIYYPPYVFNLVKPEVWRVASSFFLTGGGIGIIMDTFFLFRYASDCERSRFGRPGDMVVFLVFCGGVILLLNTFLVGGMVFGQALILALAYYWTALEDSSRKVNFYITTFPVKFLPPVMLLMTFLQAGLQATLVEMTGLVAAHSYLFLTTIWPRIGGGRNFISTPEWLHAMLEDAGGAGSGGRSGNSGVTRAAAGTPGVGAREARATASGSAVFGNQWSHRGQGHRLGS